MIDNTLDLYLTPRFWKGQLVYDGRRPLLVYEPPHQKISINEDKPYPPKYTRKLRPQDGILYELSQLKNVKSSTKSVGIKMLVCVTMYNQPIQFLERTLTGIYKNFLKLINERGMSPKDIAVVIIQDGILKLVTDRLHRKYSSSVRFFQKMDYVSGKSECKLISRINQILDQIEDLQKNGLGSFTQKNGGLPPTVPKKTSLLYQFQWKPSKNLEQQYKIQQISDEDPGLRIMACFKHLNAKKLSSHLWFFQGFCRLLNPQFCTLMDIGTEPYDTGLIKFIQALESDPNIGGVSGFMTLDINVKSSQSQMKQNNKSTALKNSVTYPLEQLCFPVPIISTIFFIIKFLIFNFFRLLLKYIGKFLECFHECFSAQRAQLFEYNFSHMFDKNFESFFKYLNVLPGAWSAYRYEAISCGNRFQQNLLQKNYLKMVLDPQYSQKNYQQANVYLAQDRILCLGIYCQKGQKFNLQYVPQALAKTDPMDNLIDLLIQRRRWINSSYFAFDYVFKNYKYDCQDSKHTCLDKHILLPTVMFFSKLSIINTYFAPAIFLFALFTSTHQTYIKFRPPTDFIRSEPLILIPAFVCLGYIGSVLSLVVISLNKKANQFKRAYIILSAILGIYNLILIVIVVVYISLNYFVPQQVPPSAALTRQIIKYLVIVNFSCLVLPIFFHIFTHPKRVLQMLDPRTFISYLYYQAAYSHTFVIYAFSNVDDVTWGTKGVQQDSQNNILSQTQKQQMYYIEKTKFLGRWIAWNGIICFLLIVINDIFVEQQNKAVILTAIGMYSTIIVVVKCIFGLFHHFKCIFLECFCLRKFKYDQNKRVQIQRKLRKRTVINQDGDMRAEGSLNRKVPTGNILPSNLIDDVYQDVRFGITSARKLYIPKQSTTNERRDN